MSSNTVSRFTNHCRDESRLEGVEFLGQCNCKLLHSAGGVNICPRRNNISGRFVDRKIRFNKSFHQIDGPQVLACTFQNAPKKAHSAYENLVKYMCSFASTNLS